MVVVVAFVIVFIFPFWVEGWKTVIKALALLEFLFSTVREVTVETVLGGKSAPSIIRPPPST